MLSRVQKARVFFPLACSPNSGRRGLPVLASEYPRVPLQECGQQCLVPCVRRSAMPGAPSAEHSQRDHERAVVTPAPSPALAVRRWLAGLAVQSLNLHAERPQRGGPPEGSLARCDSGMVPEPGLSQALTLATAHASCPSLGRVTSLTLFVSVLI